MSFVKRNYIDGETVITAENLNDIQDELIRQGEQQVEDEVSLALKANTSDVNSALALKADASAVASAINVNNINAFYSDYGDNQNFIGKYRFSQAEDWEQGTISSVDGNKPSTTRSRTKGYIPVYSGDVLFFTPVYISGSTSATYSINIWYYDNYKTYQSTSSWYVLNKIRSVTIANDGYIRLHCTSGDPTLFSKIFYLVRSTTHEIDILDNEQTIRKSSKILITGDMLVEGTYNGNTFTADSTQYTRFSTISKIKVSKNDIINTTGDDTYMFRLNVYGTDGSYSSYVDYRNAPYTVPSDGYVNFTLKKKDESAISNKSALNGFVWVETGANTVPLNNREYARYEVSTVSDLAYGAVTSQGIDPRTDRFRTVRYFACEVGDVMLVKSTGIHYVVNTYDTSGNRTSYSEWLNKSVYYVQHTGFIRIHCYKDSGTITLSDYDGLVTMLHPYHGSFEKRLRIPPVNVLRKPEKLTKSVSLGQDGTIINGKLWAFTDGEGQTGTIKIINLDTFEVESTKTHTLGHANSVDYNPLNDYLISYVRGESGVNHPAIGLYPNPSNKDSLSKSDDGFICIKLYDQNGMLSPSASLCWGEDIQTIYYIDGYYSNMNPQTKATHIDIRKIQLGLGTNDLSAGGYGTYTASSTGEYNGTAKVIKVYSGEIIDGLDTNVLSGYIGTSQGCEFDGYIYIGWGTSGNNFVKIELDDNANTYRVIDNFLYHDYADDRTEVKYEPELLALNGNKVICGSVGTSGVTNSILYEMNR